MNERVKGIAQIGVIVTIAIFAFGFLWSGINRVSDRADAATAQVAELKADISGIKTDLSWIRQTLSNNRLFASTTK